MQLEHLTESNFAVVIAACEAFESEYVTLPSGEIVRAPMSTDASYKQAYEGLRYTLYSLSDVAFVELLALALTGRAAMSGSDWDYPANLEYAKDEVSRDPAGVRKWVMDSKAAALHGYLLKGLASSRAVLRAG